VLAKSLLSGDQVMHHHKTIGQRFREDPRLGAAKSLIHQTLEEYQHLLAGPRGGSKELADQYRASLEEYGKWRGGRLYYPYLSSGIGKGALVELADGSVKYDFITGIGVHYLGHSHPIMVDAALDAALEDTIMQGNLQQNSVSAELTGSLVQLACQQGADLEHCFLTSSGAMANENALKLVLHKHSPARRILAFQRCFAGRSMVTAQITDKPQNRQGLPEVLAVDYIPFYDERDPSGSLKATLAALDQHLSRHPEEYAGMMLELIQGEGGYYAGDRAFFIPLMEKLKKAGLAIFVDEIQTFGRTSHLFAFQYYGLDPYVDVVTIGKMTQVCATLFTDQYRAAEGFISQTFTASTSAIYAAKAILEELIHGGYLGDQGKIMQMHHVFADGLAKIANRFPGVLSGPFGCGAMIACTVFKGDMQQTKVFLQELFANGVMGFICGHSPARVRFLMPIGAVTQADIIEVCRMIEETLQNIIAKG
jgi:acetylornithine aminotransferase